MAASLRAKNESGRAISAHVVWRRPSSPALLRGIEQEAVKQAPALGREIVVERGRVSPVLLRAEHPGVFVRIVEHDSRAVRLCPGAAGVPEGVVEKDRAAGWRADLDRAGK